MSTRLDEVIERVTTVDVDVDLEKETCCEAIVPTTCDRTATWLERTSCAACGPIIFLCCDSHQAAADAFWRGVGRVFGVHKCGAKISLVAWVHL